MRNTKQRKLRKIPLKVSRFFVQVSMFCVIIAILVGFIATETIRFLSNTPLFAIKETRSSVELDTQVEAFIRKSSLFTLDVDKLYSIITKKHPEYKDIYILKEFPCSLRIEIKKRQPFAQFKTKKFYPLDSEGIILSDGSPEPLPQLIHIEIINSQRTLKSGDTISDPRLSLAFALIRELKKKF